MSKEQLAEFIHEIYELAAKQTGWSTQESCRVKFKDLPEKNKETMLIVAEKSLDYLIDKLHNVIYNVFLEDTSDYQANILTNVIIHRLKKKLEVEE